MEVAIATPISICDILHEFHDVSLVSLDSTFLPSGLHAAFREEKLGRASHHCLKLHFELMLNVRIYAEII